MPAAMLWAQKMVSLTTVAQLTRMKEPLNRRRWRKYFRTWRIGFDLVTSLCSLRLFL